MCYPKGKWLHYTHITSIQNNWQNCFKTGLFLCDTLQSGRWLPMFYRNIMPHVWHRTSTRNMGVASSSKTSVAIYQTTHHHPTRSFLIFTSMGTSELIKLFCRSPAFFKVNWMITSLSQFIILLISSWTSLLFVSVVLTSLNL